jgi:hypothetical protein
MNLKDLTKEQKQYVALGAIVTAALLVLIIFGIKVSLSSIGLAKAELDEITRKIENADRSLSRHEQTKKDFVDTSAELSAFLEKMPPERNYYSWATEIIYAKARLSGLEIDAIDEQTEVRMVDPGAEKANTITLESYTLRIMARGGYGHVKYFLEQLEEDYPLIRVIGLDVSTGSDFDIHDVQLFIQWPFNLNSITEIWDAIAEKQKAVDRRGPAKTERPIAPSEETAETGTTSISLKQAPSPAVAKEQGGVPAEPLKISDSFLGAELNSITEKVNEIA